MSKSFDIVLWNLLTRSSCLSFGKECGSVIVWILLTLTLRTLVILLHIDSYIPTGFVFAFPFFMQICVKYIPSLFHTVPLLPVRFAQTLIGKTNPMNLLVLIPAHFLGAVTAVVIFRTVFPFLPNKVYDPIFYQPTWWVENLAFESLWNFFYVLIMLTAPYLLQVNRINKIFLSLPLIPLFFLASPAQTSSFNPAIVYAFWFIKGCSSLYMNSSTIPIDRIVGPLIGAIIAAVVSNMYFPDDAASWKRNLNIL